MGRFITNDLEAIDEALTGGLGIAVLPAFRCVRGIANESLKARYADLGRAPRRRCMPCIRAVGTYLRR